MRRLFPFSQPLTLALAFVLTSAASLSAQEFVREVRGAPGDFAGGSVAGGHDFNGDGFDDYIVGRPNNARTTVHSGINGQTLYVYSGTAGFGIAVEGLPDIDQDGFDDFAIGNPFGFSSGSVVGDVHFYSGRTGSLLRIISGSNVGDRFGISIAACGDVDLDGTDDVLVGADQLGQGTGYARVLSGANGALILQVWGSLIGDRFGAAVDGGHDLSNDGVADFIVGAPEARTPSVSVYSGASGGLLRRLFGDASSQHGFSVAMLPDVNGDGRGDIGVGAPMGTTATSPARSGVVRLFSGGNGVVLQTWAGLFMDSLFGYSIANGQDMNGDGIEELLVGAPESAFAGSGRQGQVFAFSADGSLLYAATQGNIPYNSKMGWAVSSAGDIDGDGFSDLIVGAPSATEGGQGSGSAFVYAGSDIALDIPRQFVPEGFQFDIVSRGVPGMPLALALIAFDGTPIFRFVAFSGYNAQGQYLRTSTAPLGFYHELTYMVFTIGSGGFGTRSNAESVQFVPLN